MNQKLLNSSMIVGFIMHMLTIYFYTAKLKILFIFTYIGIITSLLNHGTSIKIYKYIDRITMVILSFIYLYYSFNIKNEKIKNCCINLVFIMMLSYIYTKIIIKVEKNKNKSTNIHELLHYTSLLLFTLLLISNNSSFENNTVECS
jgi:hypothetical protein